MGYVQLEGALLPASRSEQEEEKEDDDVGRNLGGSGCDMVMK
jgi:hypothetical protein